MNYSKAHHPFNAEFSVGLLHGRTDKKKGEASDILSSILASQLNGRPIRPIAYLAYCAGYCEGASFSPAIVHHEAHRVQSYLARRAEKWNNGVRADVRRLYTTVSRGSRFFGDLPREQAMESDVVMTRKQGSKYVQAPPFDASIRGGKLS